MLALQIFFLCVQLGFVVFLFYLCLAFLTGAPFVPSTKSTADAMIKLAEIKKGNKIYDLGSGNGKLLLLAAKRGARAVGYEINPLLVLFSNIRSSLSPHRKDITTKWKNFWNTPVSDADVVFVYLLPFRMDALGNKLKKELKKGTLIVSNSFIFPHWKILRQDKSNHVYVFRV